MPTFRSQPSSDLASSIRRAVASRNFNNPDQINMVADQAAATTAQHMGLAEKARAEAEAIRNAEAARGDPKVSQEFASRSAGLTDAEGGRLMGHLRGAIEQPSSNDDLDASMVGKEAQPFTMEPPNIKPGQRRGFESALASTIANRIATGHTNAQQLAMSGQDINKTAVQNAATDATSVPEANKLVAAITGKVREPFKTNAQGTVLNEETGDLNEGTKLAAAVRTNLGAQAAQRTAAASGGGVELTPEARTAAAQRYRVDGTLPPNLGRGTQGAKNSIAILNEAAQLAAANGDTAEEQRIRQIANKASASALTQLSKQEAMVGAFEKNFNKNADLAIEQSKKVDRTGVPALNRWILAGKKNIAGDADVSVLDTAIKASVNEYTKIISGSMGNAAMAEGEIKKVEGLLSSASTDAQVVAVLNFMKKETGNRMTSFADQKAELTRGMRSAPAALPNGLDIEKRFSADPAMKGNKLGKSANGKTEVLDGAGKLIGYYD